MTGNLYKVRRPKNWSRPTIPAWNSPAPDGSGTIEEIPVDKLCVALQSTRLKDDNGDYAGKATEWLYCMFPGGTFVWVDSEDLEVIA